MLSLPGDDAAVLGVGDGRLVVTTDHLRAFTEDPWLLARIAAIHAMGDVWAMGAEPQAGLATIVLPRMAERMQAETLREVLAAASEALRAAGAELVGGHTTMGAETTVGFTVMGLPRGEPIGLGRARPGDALILTEPVGTGTVLAAEMQRRAQGRDVAACLEMMQRPQGEAAAILSGAHAMTDVTGFGLAGHLANLCRASGVGARLDLAAVPTLPGALELARAGVASTLAPANRQAAPIDAPPGPTTDLLYDPQTAGGLLAAVDADGCSDLLRRLHDAGHEHTAIVGELTESSLGIAGSRGTRAPGGGQGAEPPESVSITSRTRPAAASTQPSPGPSSAIVAVGLASRRMAPLA